MWVRLVYVMSTVDVSIIYLNYNSAQLTLNCIRSFYLTYCGTYSYEIIVLDNASSKEDIELLEAGLTNGETLIETGGNLGTSKAWNIGAKQVRGKYLFYVNSDMLFINDSIGILKAYMDDHDECGVSGGNLYNSQKKPTHSYRRENSPRFWKSQGMAIFQLVTFIKKAIGNSRFNRMKKPLEVAYICGADMFVRSSVFKQVGGFDENIFMYAEEADLQYQINKLGYHVMNVPQAKMIHFEGDTFKKDGTGFSEFRLVQSIKSSLYYFKKNYSEEVAKDYVRALKKNYIIKCFIYKLCLKYNKFKFCKMSIQCIDENYGEYLK